MLKAIVGLFFLNIFQLSVFWGIIYSFPVIFIYIWFNVWNYFWIPLNFFKVYYNSRRLLKTFITHIFRVNCYYFFIFIQSGKWIYELPLLKFTLWHLQYISWTESNLRSLPVISMFLNFLDIFNKVTQRVNPQFNLHPYKI